jgi:serine/threonine-protein kinase
MKIGRYELVALLGEGGMARAYLAVSRGPIGFDKLVVVKQVRPEYAHDREFLTMFFDEARIASRLNHPNVVQTYEAIEDDGQYLLAMEYLEGKTLTEVLRRVGRSDMPLEEHLWILAQVLSGLHYAHELLDYDGTPLDVVHRDVSPSNVFITYNGEVKLLDFGIAKAEGALGHTRTGVVKGKVAYGAPEQFAGQRVDRRADIFSVGVMLWEALARQRRKVSDSPVELFQAVCGGGLIDIRHVNPKAPTLLAEICGRATASDPTDRQANATEFLDDLDIYLESARRVDRRNVASLMERFFSDDRQKLVKRIEDQLGATRYVLPRQVAHPPSRAPIALDPPPPKAPDVAAAGPREPKRSRRFVRRYVVVAGLLAAFGPLALFPEVHGWKNVASFTEPIAAAAPGMTARAVVAPAAVLRHDRVAPLEKPDTIRLSIKVEPSSATLELDGFTLDANPFRGEVRRAATGSHLLRAVAPGYYPFERSISLARDVNMIFALRPLGARVPRPQKPDNKGRRLTSDVRPQIDQQNPYGP